jgi:transposase InsO family protein
MCKVFKTSKSSYYEWLKSSPSKRWQENEELLSKINKVYHMSNKSYGSPRICHELKAAGVSASRPRIARIMKASGLRALASKRFIATTDSKHKYPIVDNVLNRSFSVDRKNQVWVSDITYVRTNQGWLYLTVIIDLFDRKVIGWAMSKDLSAQNTSIKAWRMAKKKYPITDTLIFHSDRGIQYACTAFANILNGNKFVTRSMSRKGNCWDNAVAESFFKSLKVEWVYTKKYACGEEAQLSIFEWMETWYNTRRRHSALGYMTINEFENQLNKQSIAA